MKIELSGKKGEGLHVLVDEEDFERFSHLKWNLNTHGYAVTNTYDPETKKRKRSGLHRLITNCPEGLTVDHINRDKLDNRKENLRICTKTDNNRNRSKRCDSKNKYRGYAFHNKNKNFIAQISVNGKNIHLGCFKTEEEAAMAYNEAAYIYFGKFANLNKVILN